jgi:serine/threonine-protein kinase
MGGLLFAERYRVIRRLGTGGTATVFLACDERLQREVAIKRIHGAEVTAETALRLQREARIMASLRHPNLVTVFDMVTDDDDLLLVMEYVRGGTLAEVLAPGPLSWERTRALLEPVAAALDCVHEHGVIHRDLKPSNILVATSGLVKVADLGLATAAEITRITPPGEILGTPAYMAPEQARPGMPCSRRVDIYALATIAYEALSGTRPRTGRTVVAILAEATQQPPPDLRERRPGTPRAAAEALMRAMSANPDDRPDSASRLLRDLDTAFKTQAAQSAAHARSPAVAPHRRRQAPRVLAILALTAAIGALAVLLAAGFPGARESDPRLGARARSTQTPQDAARPRPGPSTSTPTPAQATGTPTATPRALSPAGTVRAFYRRAASGDYKGAWSLAGPAMRQAFGNSLQQFRADLASLEHVEFRRVAIVDRNRTGVTVQIETVATHHDRVDHCTGTVRTVRGTRGRWLVEPAGLRCSSQ